MERRGAGRPVPPGRDRAAQRNDLIAERGGVRLQCSKLDPDGSSLVESRLRPGAVIVADNADHSPEYLAHVRAPANGYMSTPFAEDVEMSVRMG